MQDNAEDGGQSPEQEDEGQGSEHEDGNDRTRVDEGEDIDANHGAEWQESGGEGTAAGNTWQCEVCHIWSKVASHLRQSNKCLTQLKSKPQFQFKGSEEDEVFIAKFSLIKGECPRSCCPTGCHTEVPQGCVKWWKSEGWSRMGWKGDKENADSKDIREKIRNFVRMYERRKKTQQSQSESGTQASQSTWDFVNSYLNETGTQCSYCGHNGDLVQHLIASCQCRQVYVKNNLTEEEGGVRKSIFDLCIVLKLCARVGCTHQTEFTYLAPHLKKSNECLDFYRSEGVHLGLPGWSLEASPAMISKKIAQMRRMINTSKREQGCGFLSFKHELSQLLAHVCCRCGAMGPVEGEDDFVLKGGWTDADGNPVWFCSTCSEESPEFKEVKQKLEGYTERLKGPQGSQVGDIKVVSCSVSGSLIVAPMCLTEGRPAALQFAPSLSTRVLVPYDASAIRAIKRWCDEAFKDKHELQECVQELLRRPFVTNFQTTLSCLYRSLLANVRQRMGRILMASVTKVPVQVYPQVRGTL